MALSRREMISMMGGGAVYAAQNAPVPVTRQLHTELSPKWIRVRFGGEVIADSRRALIMLGRGTPAYYIGMEGLRAALYGDGYYVYDEQHPRVVVSGLDSGVTYAKLKIAALAIKEKK